MQLPLAAGIGHHKNSRTQAHTSEVPFETAVVHHQLPFRSEAYTLAYYLGSPQTAESPDYTLGEQVLYLKQAGQHNFLCHRKGFSQSVLYASTSTWFNLDDCLPYLPYLVPQCCMWCAS